MGKIQNFFTNQKNSVRNIFFRYFLTLVTVIFLCGLTIYRIETDNFYNSERNILDDIMQFFILFSVGTFWVESVWNRENNRQIINKQIIPCVIVAVISFFVTMFRDFLTEYNDYTSYYYVVFGSLYMGVMIGCAIYYIIKQNDLTISEYITNLVFDVLRIGGIILGLNIGFLLLLLIFNALLFDIDEYDVLLDIEILLCGFIYTPYALICLTDKNKKKSKFIKGFLFYALIPMLLAAFAIIYAYVFKMIFTLELPNNEVFNICAVLFVIGVIIWTMSYSFIENEEIKGFAVGNKYHALIKYLKYFYAPFVILEIICIAIRINQCGITTARYFAVMFVVLQLIYIFWEPILKIIFKLLNKDEEIVYGQKYEYFIWIFIAAYIIGFVFPFANAEHIEYFSQKARFDDILAYKTGAEIDLLGSDFEEAKSIYYALNSNIYGDAYLNKRSDSKYLSEYFDYFADSGNMYSGEEWQDIYRSTDKPPHISGYDYLYDFSFYKSDRVVVSGRVSIEYGDGSKKTADINIEDLIDKVVEDDVYNNYSSNPDYLPYEIVTADGRKILIHSISFNIEKNKNEMQYLSISGYVLE